MARSYDHHVILGAGGAISRALVPELLRNRQQVTLVSRSGRPVEGARSIAADILDDDALEEAVPEGSAVYLLVGLPYRAVVWEEAWPQIMRKVIRVCSEKRALLVFFDNVYMYGPVDGPMTEQTPHNPTSRKGAVRAEIVETLDREVSAGSLSAIVARSADFYGPGAERNGIMNLLIIEKLLAGKAAQWVADADVLHSVTYTTDCGRAVPLLVADETSYNQVWHMPTASPPITMRRFTEIAAREIGAKPKLSVLSPWMLRLAGIFDRTVRELPEMLYQNDRDYIFDSSKLTERYAFAPTSYEQGIAETVAYYRSLGG
jgi:nucleoside-diphosphate-sugar epimerase